MTCGDKFNKNCPTGGTRVDPAEADGRPVCDHPGCGKKLRGDGTCVDGHGQGQQQRLASPQVRTKKALRDLVATLDGAGLILTDEEELARELRQWQKPQAATVQEIMALLPELDGAGVIVTDESLLRRELRAQGYRDTSVEVAQEMLATYAAEIAQADNAVLFTDPLSGATHLSLQQGNRLWRYTRALTPEEGGFGGGKRATPEDAQADLAELAEHPDVAANRHCLICGQFMAADGSHACPGAAQPPVAETAATEESPPAARGSSYWSDFGRLLREDREAARARYPGTPDTAAAATAAMQELLRAITGRDDFSVLAGSDRIYVEPHGGHMADGQWRDFSRRDKNLLQAVTGVAAHWFGRAAFGEGSWREMVRHLETVRAAQAMLTDSRVLREIEDVPWLANTDDRGALADKPHSVPLAQVGPMVLRTLPTDDEYGQRQVELTVMEDLSRPAVVGHVEEPRWKVHTFRQSAGGELHHEVAQYGHDEAHAIVEAKRQEAVQARTLHCFSCGCPYGARQTCPNCGQQKKRTRLWAPGWRRKH